MKIEHAIHWLLLGFSTCLCIAAIFCYTFRFDFWSPSAWSAYANQRRQKRDEVANLAQRLDALPPGTTMVIGGDFNMPKNDGAWDDMPPYLHDSFDEAGMGWGNTMSSNMPVVRFDQIWLSENLKATAVTTHTTVHSDHRMVICDIATAKM